MQNFIYQIGKQKIAHIYKFFKNRTYIMKDKNVL